MKRSVSLAEMNNMIIILLQQYNSFCLYIATVSIKFLLIPPFFSLSRQGGTRVEDEAVKNADRLCPRPKGVGGRLMERPKERIYILDL